MNRQLRFFEAVGALILLTAGPKPSWATDPQPLPTPAQEARKVYNLSRPNCSPGTPGSEPNAPCLFKYPSPSGNSELPYACGTPIAYPIRNQPNQVFYKTQEVPTSGPFKACACQGATFNPNTAKNAVKSYFNTLKNDLTLAPAPYGMQPLQNLGPSMSDWMDEEIIHGMLGEAPTTPIADSASVEYGETWSNLGGYSGDGPNECVHFMKLAIWKSWAQYNLAFAELDNRIGNPNSTVAKLGFNLDPRGVADPVGGATSPTNIPIPDPRVPFSNAKLLKDKNNQPYPPGWSYEKTVREFIGDQFERMARVYIAGSDQLSIDYPNTPFVGTAKIHGLYEGFAPNLLGTSPPAEFPSNFGGELGCNSGPAKGITDTQNLWFKFGAQSSPQRESSDYGGWTNHRCHSGSPGMSSGKVSHSDKKYAYYPTFAGLLIHQSMVLMENIRDHQIKQGYLLPVKSYYLPSPPPPPGNSPWPASSSPGSYNPATKMMIEINGQRNKVFALWTEYNRGLNAAGGEKKGMATACAEQSNSGRDTVISESGNGEVKLTGAQAGACLLAAIQNRIEINMVVRLAYYNWQFVTNALLVRGQRTLFDLAGLESEGFSSRFADSLDNTATDPVHAGISTFAASALLFSRRLSRRRKRKLMSTSFTWAFVSGALFISTFGAPQAHAMFWDCKKTKDVQAKCGEQNKYSEGGVDMCTNDFNTRFDPEFQKQSKAIDAAKSQFMNDANNNNEQQIGELDAQRAALEDQRNAAVEECKKNELYGYNRRYFSWNPFSFGCHSRIKYDNVDEARSLCSISANPFQVSIPTPGGPAQANVNTLKDFQNLINPNGGNQRSVLGSGDYNALTPTGVNDQSASTLSRSGATAGGDTGGTPNGTGAGGLNSGNSGDASSGQKSGGYGSGRKVASDATNGLGSGSASGSGGGSGSGGFGFGSGSGSNGGSAASGTGANGEGDGTGAGLGGGKGDGSDDTYAGGRGGGAQRSAAGAGADGSSAGLFGGLFNFGDKNGGAGGAGNGKELAFGDPNGQNGAGFNTMGSNDPEDYFNRIGKDESLFKKVERRYGEKAIHWAMDATKK